LKPPGCYYRIDPKRTNQNNFIGLTAMMTGVEMYIEKFENQMITNTLKHQLRGTLFNFITQCNFKLVKNLITKEEHSYINKHLLEIMQGTEIFNKSHKKLIHIYNQ